MVSGPGVRSGHGAILPFSAVCIGLTLAEDTKLYVPSNAVPAVDADRVCALAAASKPKIPTIDSSPIRIRMAVSSSPYQLATIFVQAASARSGFAHSEFVRAVLMRAFLRAARSAVRRVHGAALDADACPWCRWCSGRWWRSGRLVLGGWWSGPPRLWVTRRSPTPPPIPEGKPFFDARPFSIQLLKSSSIS